jgi:hypothetical protein
MGCGGHRTRIFIELTGSTTKLDGGAQELQANHPPHHLTVAFMEK